MRLEGSEGAVTGGCSARPPEIRSSHPVGRQESLGCDFLVVGKHVHVSITAAVCAE